MTPLTPTELTELLDNLCLIEDQPHYKPRLIEPNKHNAMYYRFADRHRRHISFTSLRKILQENADKAA